MHCMAYLRVWSVLAQPLLRLSGGRWYCSSFRVLKSSFWVLAFADWSLLQRQHTYKMTRLLIPLYLLWYLEGSLHVLQWKSRIETPKIGADWVKWLYISYYSYLMTVLPAAAGWRVVLLWTDQTESIVTTGRGKALKVWATEEKKEVKRTTNISDTQNDWIISDKRSGHYYQELTKYFILC